MNGLTGTRRLARPVRLVLAARLGSDIDGAWWPHSGSVAGELPQLIEALHRPLGEIIDICVNWSAAEPTLDYGSMVATRSNGTDRRHRLMMVAGRSARVKLLVVPHMTTPTLGTMVMRCAASRPVSDSERATQVFESAEGVLRAARIESATWTSREYTDAETV